MSKITFHDYKPEALNFYDAVVQGLSSGEKSIPPKFFYDERGSVLFERICEQPEYYPPAVEIGLLARHVWEIAALAGEGRLLIEPGAGSAAKARLLLDALRPSAYVPMDISFDYLKISAWQLAVEFPWLPVHAVCADFTHSLPIPPTAPDMPRLLFFPGSSLGNFDIQEAAAFLGMVREILSKDGMLLIGVDTKKPESKLHAAYNDAAGMTAKFNLNLLHRLRRELFLDLNPEDFEHRAFYNSKVGRIEMHLVSKRQQTLRLSGHDFTFEKGESMHTESSYKYAPEEFLLLASRCGFSNIRHWIDDERLFAIYLLGVKA